MEPNNELENVEVVDTADDEAIEEAACGDTQLPLAPLDHPWDGDAAVKRVRKWASSDNSGDKDKIDWVKYRRAFFRYDPKDAKNFGSYQLPFADVINGRLHAVWKGVAAALRAVRGARRPMDIPQAEKEAILRRIRVLYRRFKKPFPEDDAFNKIWADVEKAETIDEIIEAYNKACTALEALEELKNAQSPLVDEEMLEECREIVDEADAKVQNIAKANSELIEDSFDGTLLKLTEEEEQGGVKFEAIVAQVDKPNANRRIYPRKEIMKNLPRIRREMRQGKFVCL